MANLHLVTGYAGKDHISAADFGSFNASIFGEGQYILKRGNQFEASVVTNNLIRVLDGDALMQGRHIRLAEGTYVDLAIENGTQGKLRNDLVVIRYTKDATTGIEESNLVVLKGTETDSSPVDPEYTTGNIINDHVIQADMLLWRIPLDGLNVGTPVKLYEEANLNPTLEDLGAAPANHDHDNRYYTEAEIDSKFENLPPPYTYGTEDLTPGVSELPAGQLYIVYE